MVAICAILGEAGRAVNRADRQLWGTTAGRLFLAGSGGCPYSPKTDLKKQRDFSTDRLRAQLRIHTLGQLQTVAIPNSRHSTFDMNGIMRGNLLPVSWRILFLPVAFDI